MNGNVTRPPPPVRRPSPMAGSDGYDLKGLSGNMDKSRGAMGIPKISRAENLNPTQGANRVAAQNHDWIKVKTKGPRETGLVSKEFLKVAKNSKHTYFADSHSNAEGSSSNRFSNLENGVFQPLDTSSQLIKGPDQLLLVALAISPSYLSARPYPLRFICRSAASSRLTSASRPKLLVPVVARPYPLVLYRSAASSSYSTRSSEAPKTVVACRTI
ncbi:hypothetical protein DH2020_043082 [Rehmannia glutinosa]|uniref:Uncharacterized protein n=1 Tax=Rehmannia glutinosa TaxID=99300 RepID=A0ABR0UMI0_REHGL